MKGLRLSVLALAAMAAACSSSASSQSSPITGDAQVPDDAGAEAGPVAVDQDPNVYPAKHHALASARDFGGPTLYAPKIVTVTFAGDAWRDDLRAFDDGVVTTDWWKLVGHSYGIDVGTSGGYAELPDTVSGKTVDNATDIQPFLKTLIANHTLPTPDAQTLYVLYYPTATTITFEGDASCVSGMKGFHDWTEVQVGSQSVDVPYVVLPRCSTAEADLTYAASHEMIEGATDPFPSGPKGAWYILDNNAFTGPGGAEVADICVFAGPVTQNGWAVAHVWSNEAAAASHDPCQPGNPNRVFYGAVPETEIVTVTDPAGTHPSDGYVTLDRGLDRGASKDVLVVVFSEAPLPNDLTLVVGSRTSSIDPTKVGAIAPGVTATLSKTAAHNGTELLLSLSATPDAKAGEYGFVVRAILSPSDYHSWPVILRLQ